MTSIVARLHAVTNDDVLALPDFWDRAMAIAGAGDVAIQLRSHTLLDRDVLALAERLRSFAPILFVNDRLDIARMVAAEGVHLPETGLPLAVARTVAPLGMTIGRSTHAVTDAIASLDAGADYVFLGPIWPTESHPHVPSLSPASLADMAGAHAIAIGGITVDRVPLCTAAGAYGVAAIRSLWYADDPRAAADAMLVSFIA